MSIDLSIIIPAYNEAARLGNTLQTVLGYLNEEWADRAELIVVDDGSTDETVEIAGRSLARSGRVRARVLCVEPNKGKGYAVRTGLLASRGRVALFSDADLSTPITETPKLVAPIINDEADVVFGSRALNRRLIEVRQSWRREQGGRVFNRITRLLTGLKFHDTQCGFKAFRADVCRHIFAAATIDRFGFDVELLYVAQLAGLRLRETPVRWAHVEGSKVEVMRDSLRMFNEVRAIRRQARRGIYADAVSAVLQARQMLEHDSSRLTPHPARQMAHDDAARELISTASRA